MKMPMMLLAGLAVAALTFGSVDTAEARCVSCDVKAARTHVKTVYKTRTINRVKTVTRYRNVERPRYVKHVTRVVTRTVIRPITRVNTITRVHNRTYVISQTQRSAETRTLAPRTVAGTSRTVTINHRPVAASCGCRT